MGGSVAPGLLQWVTGAVSEGVISALLPSCSLSFLICCINGLEQGPLPWTEPFRVTVEKAAQTPPWLPSRQDTMDSYSALPWTELLHATMDRAAQQTNLLQQERMTSCKMVGTARLSSRPLFVRYVVRTVGEEKEMQTVPI